MHSGVNDDKKAIYISLAMGLIELVKYEEELEKMKSARANSLRNLYENCGRVIDFYRLVTWPLDKQILASDTLNKVEIMVNMMFFPETIPDMEEGTGI